jgi:serine/threonine protein kinase
VEDEIKFPEYVDVTDEAKDLILKIMKKKPEERIEIKEIMRHPFITKYLKDRKVAPEVLEEFRRVLNG